MDKEAISRAALGNIASLGTLYDARSDKFCGISIFKKRIPSEALTLTDAHFSDIQLVHTDDFAEKFHKLDVQAELQVSVLGGLFTLEGSGHYLNDQKKSSRTVKSSLIYNVKTKDENVNIYHEDLKEAFAIDAIQSGVATHVVVGISWGANSVLTCSYENRENRDVKEISGSLSAHLKMMSLSIDGKVSVEYKDGENEKGTNFDIRMFGDILPSKEDLPTTTEGALALMKQMPSLVAACNEGRGKPLTYTLLPLRLLQDYLQFQMKADMAIKSLEEASLLRVVKMFDSMAKAQQKLHDFHEDALDNQFCVPDPDMAKISSLKEEAALEETRFRGKLAETLIKVRSGKAEVSEVENLLKEFQESEFSPEKITCMLDTWADIIERVNFAKTLVTKGATYIGIRGNLDEEILKRFDDKSFVLYFNIKSKTEDPQRWAKNRQLFFVELAKQSEGCLWYAVDCDIHPGLMPINCSSCVQVVQSGKVITEDLLADQEASASIPFAQIIMGTVRIVHKPNKRCPLTIRCTGKSCDPAEEYTWKCSRCKSEFEWGFDNHVYCNCGMTPVNLLEFKCPHPDHGVGFEKHDDSYLSELVAKLTPFKELNILILGETGVGKSTWINAFNNFVNYDSINEAEAGELFTLIPSSFTVCDENFKQITVKTGTDKNECEVQGQSATQDARIYRFNVGKDTTIQLVDTPGIGDTRGIEQDKKNFQNILTTIGHLGELHGICILLKPNNARLTVMFRFCIKELLTYLHRDASKNIVFCFTNARGTFYRPGDTMPALQALLAENKEVEIAISKHTVYCFDSEAYRFLAAIKNEEPVAFDEDEKQNFSKSWEKSITETRRMLEHIEALPAHPIQSTLNLNHAREMVLKLTRPLAEISSNIHRNKAIAEDEKKELEDTEENIESLKKKQWTTRVAIKVTQLNFPRTVCNNSKCVKVWNQDGVVIREHITICHDNCALGNDVQRDTVGDIRLLNCAAIWPSGNGTCRCGHSYLEHLHVYYKSDQVVEKIQDQRMKEDLAKGLSASQIKQKALEGRRKEIEEYEQELLEIQQASVKFAYFLKTNAITPYNDEMEQYLNHLLKEEKDKVAAGGNEKTLNRLTTSKQEYLQEKRILEEAMKDGSNTTPLTPAEIEGLINGLKALKHSGETLKQALDGVQMAANHVLQSGTVFYQPPPPKRILQKQESVSIGSKVKGFLKRTFL